MYAFDRAMNMLDEKFAIIASRKQMVSCANNEDKVYTPELHTTCMNVTILESILLRSLVVLIYQHYICA